MNVCPRNTFCFPKDRFIIFLILGFIVLFYVYYKLSNDQMKQMKASMKPRLNQQSKQQNDDRTIVTTTSVPIETIPLHPEHINDFNRTYRRISDPLEVPKRTYPFTEDIYNRVINYQPAVPINIPTRGVETYFQPIGALTSNTNPNRVLQLYGRAIYPGSNKWQYYTNTDAYQSVKVTIRHNRRDCLNDLGCDQVYQGDTVEVPAYHGETFRVELYNIDKPRYVSYLV